MTTVRELVCPKCGGRMRAYERSEMIVEAMRGLPRHLPRSGGTRAACGRWGRGLVRQDRSAIGPAWGPSWRFAWRPAWWPGKTDLTLGDPRSTRRESRLGNLLWPPRSRACRRATMRPTWRLEHWRERTCRQRESEDARRTCASRTNLCVKPRSATCASRTVG